jgi:RNA polymerase sigma-70 factor (ECF subfamily)
MPDLEQDLRAARGGSRDAIGQLLEAYRPYLLDVAQRELAEELRAKVGVSDLLQETYLEAYQAFPAFRGRTDAELRAWLQRILVNNATNLSHRFRSTAKRRLDLEHSLDGGPRGPGLAAELSAGDGTPGSQAIAHEEDRILEEALARLPEDYRRVILLHHRESLDFAEVSRRLGRSEAATRKLWARAVERWRLEVAAIYGQP